MTTTTFYRALMTRDVTESINIPIKITVEDGMTSGEIAAAVRTAAHEKVDSMPERAWSLDDGNDHDAYFGDSNNPGPEIPEVLFNALEAEDDAMRKAENRSMAERVAFDTPCTSVAKQMVLDALPQAFNLPENADTTRLIARVAEILAIELTHLHAEPKK